MIDWVSRAITPTEPTVEKRIRQFHLDLRGLPPNAKLVDKRIGLLCHDVARARYISISRSEDTQKVSLYAIVKEFIEIITSNMSLRREGYERGSFGTDWAYLHRVGSEEIDLTGSDSEVEAS